jgi:hypothetical protein
MAQNVVQPAPPQSAMPDQDLFTEVRFHYDLAVQDLNNRIMGATGFDKIDELFRSYIDKSKWPYRTLAFVPKTFEFIIEKTSRLISSKLRGRVRPRGDDDVVKAKITNEILDMQWDSANNDGTMIEKWALMDMNARKYGASFGVCYWRTDRRTIKGKDGSVKKKTFFDGPEFRVLPNRDVLANPSYSSVKNWFQYREWLTYAELENAVDAKGEKIFKNLSVLKDSMMNKEAGTGDNRSSAYQSRNKSISGLDDTLGQDTFNKVVEVVTELRNDRWIKFSPRHGVVLQDIPNPYPDGEIPVVMLKYYPIDDDLYGLSEVEPVMKLLRIQSALMSQYMDTVNTDLYPPLIVKSTGVQMHTIEFGPNKKWIADDPGNIVRFPTNTAATNTFSTAYSVVASAINSAIGETSQGVSQSDPFNPDKTATEIKDSAQQRVARDNYNQIFLSDALKRQMMLWMSLDSQYISKPFITRVIGKDTMQYFMKTMMIPETDHQGIPTGGYTSTAETYTNDTNPETGEQLTGVKPVVPVNYGGKEEPKFSMDATGEGGWLIVEPDDLQGTYDYIPDVSSMSLATQDSDRQAKLQAFQLITSNPVVLQGLQQEGSMPKFKDLLVELLEDTGLKDAERFFTEANQAAGPGQQMPPDVAPQMAAQGMQPPQAPPTNPNQVSPQQLLQVAQQAQGQPPQGGPPNGING